MKTDTACIGVLLKKCREVCLGCWFSSSKGGPTLVSIAVFTKIQDKRTN
jgi:hypothetical protein